MCARAGRRAGAAALLAALLAAGRAGAEPDPAFARQLLRERDYFRAITVYKELSFREPDPERRAAYTYEIGQAYRLSRRHELALEVLGGLAPRAPASLAGRVKVQLAYAAVGLHAAGVAWPYLADARASGAAAAEGSLLGGWLQLEGGQLDEARRSLALAREQAAPGSPALALATDLDAAAARLPDLPSRRPWLAAVMSAVVPGSGQLYAGHPVDGAQALGFVGVFGLTTYLAYDHDRRRDGPYILTGISAVITAVFYAANVLGAERAARYHNLRQREKLLGDLQRRVLALEF